MDTTRSGEHVSAQIGKMGVVALTVRLFIAGRSVLQHQERRHRPGRAFRATCGDARRGFHRNAI